VRPSCAFRRGLLGSWSARHVGHGELGPRRGSPAGPHAVRASEMGICSPSPAVAGLKITCDGGIQRG
jgi:hypothetical protein